jgi:tetratricopeptide (TPR) repeat protein
MKFPFIPFGLFIIFSLAFVARFRVAVRAEPEFVPYAEYLKSKTAIGCGSSGTDGFDWRYDEPQIPLLQGWGNFRWNVTAANDSALIYFNQGINMYYSFHMIEARASFARAARFDPDCAMAFWGLAMAYGVNYNYAMLRNAPEAMEAMAQALRTTNDETPLERELIATLPFRYNADTTVPRSRQNADYEKGIRRVFDKYPDDPNVNALYADALMVQHPWDMYDIHGKPKPWTPQIVSLLEHGLQKHPDHPSLNHLYIHAMEAGDQANKALSSAWRLSTMMPMVSHMVHMPSHIFIRTGYYKEGIMVNDSSIHGFNAYLAQFPEVEGEAFLYLIHNLHMKAACTMYRGSAQAAMEAAKQLQGAIPSKYMEMGGGLGNYMQYAYSTPTMVQIRFGWWDSLLAAPRMNDELKYGWAIQTFGKGMALCKKGNSIQAETMLNDLKSLEKDASLKQQFETINPAIKGLGVMVSLLQATIAWQKKDTSASIAFYTEAGTKEDAFMYQEPRDWLLPARHYLGAALLASKDFAGAEKVYQTELVINPNNVWSLCGLVQAQSGLKKKNEATQVRKLFNLAMEGADVKLSSSAM